ncbi:putative undecaprenyl diphosphate synthase-domain-containing protein [Haematococcus lacustris]
MLTWLRRGCALSLLPGGVPQHVAFVMDGNRRFATKQHIDKAAGHSQGYSKMIDVIHWCLELGVGWISVYAFSIDNFKRSVDEVQALMTLAEQKFLELTREDGLAEREGVEIRILGDLQLAPPGVQGAAARLMAATAALPRKRAVLNICFSYTAGEEWVGALASVQAGQQSGLLQPQDVTQGLMLRCLRTEACPPVDLLIRTSGETRLSDFLLWQCAHAQLAFVETLWPDFSFLDFARWAAQNCIHSAGSRFQAQGRQPWSAAGLEWKASDGLPGLHPQCRQL